MSKTSKKSKLIPPVSKKSEEGNNPAGEKEKSETLNVPKGNESAKSEMSEMFEKSETIPSVSEK